MVYPCKTPIVPQVGPESLIYYYNNIYGITNKEEICGDADEPKDIEEWKGVSIEDGEVVAIMWGELDLNFNSIGMAAVFCENVRGQRE